ARRCAGLRCRGSGHEGSCRLHDNKGVPMSGSGVWMLYGANGFTGELIAEEAVARGERPVLAGRRADAVLPLAERLGLPSRIFGLDGDVSANLEGVSAVLHSAGPFSATSKPMLDA